MPGVEHVIEYHAVAQGTCWAAIPGGPSVQLGAGDVVMFPHGDAHVVSSAPGLRGRARLSSGSADAGSTRLPLRLAYGGLERGAIAPSPTATPRRRVVCGFLGCDLQPFNPLIAALPRMLHLRGRRRRRLDRQLHAAGGRRIARAPARRRGDAGADERDDVRRRGAALCRRACRPRAAAGSPACATASSAARWRCCTRSRRTTGASTSSAARSACRARRCTSASSQLIGVAPMQYLAQWRMQAAARLLLETPRDRRRDRARRRLRLRGGVRARLQAPGRQRRRRPGGASARRRAT